jgi:hypothetical protein
MISPQIKKKEGENLRRSLLRSRKKKEKTYGNLSSDQEKKENTYSKLSSDYGFFEAVENIIIIILFLKRK